MRTIMTAAIRYDPHNLEILASLEERHFWFRARRRIIVDALQRWFPGPRRYLEIGSGTGYVAQGIAEAFPQWDVVASDALARDASMLKLDVRAIPFRDSFDVVGAYDVLEHIDDDGAALDQLRATCRKGGGLLLTVPQHPFLWSPADRHAGHCRRYRRRDLEALLRGRGFEILQSASFNSVNLPLFALRSWFLNATGRDPGTAVPAPPVNWLLERSMELDRWMIACGTGLKMGASLLVAARRRD
jgi:SAM-dependent methyltransferase